MKKLLIFSIACFFTLSFSYGRSFCHSGIPPVRAISLGGWLVTEGWIKPSLFDGIPNNDLLDGTQLQFKSVKMGKYLSAESGGGSVILVNETAASNHWVAFNLWRINETSFNLRVCNRRFVGLNNENGIRVVAVANTPGRAETFEIHRNPKDAYHVRIKASNGYFLQVKTEKLVTADYEGNGGWADNNPSVFLLQVTKPMQGEYQVTNGYGPLRAPKVMKKHWSTFIAEKDFKFMKKNGFNAVRVPVGWWIAHDPNPPKPFVGGSLHFLDKAFFWAEKYGLKVIVDLHCAPGSQNGIEHSGTRDIFHEWGQNDSTIGQTVDVIDFLTARYAKRPSLFAVELVNEPIGTGITLQSLIKFYKAGYEAVRRHSSTAYVILSNRFQPGQQREFLSLAKGMNRSVIDVHYYNVYAQMFIGLTVDQNIDYIYEDRAQQLRDITMSNGPLIFVGEWTAELPVQNATKEDYQRFAKAQQQVYGNVTFGWAYWSLKNAKKHWSMEWMIKNGYIKI